MADNYIIITTINGLRPEIKSFLKGNSWKILLIGDKKSVPIENSKNLTFYSYDIQQSLGFRISGSLPDNHYARKNIGYLIAMREQASLIYETDDDNFPLDHWEFPGLFCSKRIHCDSRFFNIHQYFSSDFSWPRGFPLEYIQRKCIYEISDQSRGEIGVWQGLVLGDPDVDAIYRLTVEKMPNFNCNSPVFLSSGVYSPFNSQNTFWNKKAFPLMYLPVTVNPRFTDILRSYIAQALMRKHGLHLGFTAPSLIQSRNHHDLMRDFRDEESIYLLIPKIVEMLETIESGLNFIQGLKTVYQLLNKEGIVESKELDVLDMWCENVTILGY